MRHWDELVKTLHRRMLCKARKARAAKTSTCWIASMVADAPHPVGAAYFIPVGQARTGKAGKLRLMHEANRAGSFTGMAALPRTASSVLSTSSQPNCIERIEVILGSKMK
jgi:fructose-1,6-bisphosphatase